MESGIWKQQNPISAYKDCTIYEFLGDPDANTEWKQDPHGSSMNFFHTKSYETFKEIQFLYLFGRRGTGKSSILRMLDYEIKSNNNGNYICSCLVNQDKILTELSSQLRGSPLSQLSWMELVIYLRDKWDWVLSTSAMIAVYNQYGIEMYSDHNIKIIHNFLKDKELIREDSVIKKLQSLIIDTLNRFDIKNTPLLLILSALSSDIFSTEYEEAKKALFKFLIKMNGYCLVLLDSHDLYDLKDQISQAVVTALIESVRKSYENLKQNHVLVKVAFPAEIYSHLRYLNPGKIEGKNIFIRWSYRDIACLVAKIFYNKLEQDKNKVTIEDLEDKNISIGYLYGYFPREVETELNIPLDTLAYIVRHTFKTPRQVILIFNIILSVAKERGISDYKLNSEMIRDGVHARLDMLINESLHIYEMVYNGAQIIVEKILSKEKNIFHGSYLDKVAKKASSEIRRNNLSVEEAKRLLVECGAIGFIMTRNYAEKYQKEIVETLFIYQVKEFFAAPDDFYCAIHPMMYQEFFNLTNEDKMIYPVPYEDEEKEVLNRIGVRLI